MAEPILRDGAWWHETKDGWVVWDAAAKSWGPSAGPPPPPAGGAHSPVAAAASFALSHWSTLLPVSGLLVYAVARVAHDEFYARLAVTAEDVGLDQALILSRAALYLFLYLIGFTVLVAVAPLWIEAVEVTSRTKSGDGLRGEGHSAPRPAHVVRVVGVAILLLLMVGNGVRSLPIGLTTPDDEFGQPPDWLVAQGSAIVVLLLTIGAAIAAFGGWVRLDRAGRDDDSPSTAKLRRRQRWLILLALTSFFFSSFVLAGRYGFIRGDQVLRGEAVVPGPLSLLSVSADPVCVDWPGEDVPKAIAEASEEPFMYLGQANGFLILYDRDQGAPLRVPAGKAVLRIAYPEYSCP